MNESLETSVEGVFACGNVLHVHDLVDYVSEEAGKAGYHAAEYISKWDEEEAEASKEDSGTIEIQTMGGIRYSVPQVIRLSHMEEKLTVRFRVGAVFKDVYISVYLGEKRIIHKKKKKLAPGEMERLSHMEEKLTVRFRVGAVFKDVYISVYLGEKRIIHKKKKKLAPGEMEQIILKKTDLTSAEGLDRIVMKIEEAE